MSGSDDESSTAFEQLVDRLSEHKAFTDHQQTQLQNWKTRVSAVHRSAGFRPVQRTARSIGQYNSQYVHGGKRSTTSSKKAHHPNKQPLKSNLSVPTGPGTRFPNNTYQHLTIEATKPQVTRTHSAPAERETEPEIHSHLERMCGEVIEKALD